MFTDLLTEDAKFVWKHRAQFVHEPRMLSRVIEAAPVWRTSAQTTELWSLARSWAQITPAQALLLLRPRHADPSMHATELRLTRGLDFY